MRRWIACYFLLTLAVLARAQSVHWEGSPDDPSEVQLVFEECSPDGDPRLPLMTDNALTLTGNSTNTSVINGSFSRSQTLTYSVRAKRQGAVLQIPAFTVETNKGPKQVAAYTGGAARVVSDETINSRLITSSPTVWAGEVFSLTYVLNGARRNFSQIASAIDWNSSPLVVEGWPANPEIAELSLNGEPRINAIYRTRGYAKAPGTVQLNPVSQLVNLVTGSIGFGLFQQQRVEQLSVTSKRPEITVKPLPPGAPDGFTGAVGDFKLISKVIPSSAAVGEPITWTLELSGTGNWPDIPGLPQREVSKDFQIVQPPAKRTPVEGKMFDAKLAEDVVLVPTHPGTYTLNPVTFVYFDPKTGQYQTLTTPHSTVTVTPAANAPSSTPRFPIASPDETAPAAPEKSALSSAVAAPAAPAGIPRDALAGSDHTAAPDPGARVLAYALIPFAVLLAFWAWLAVQRARVTDPLRPRREARARVLATLARLRSAPAADRPALLVAWQHDTATLWQLDHAAPPATAMADEAWQKLWTEADRALYRANTELPSDWLARAEAAVVAKRVPGFSPFSALRPRNLAPFAVLLVLFAVAPHLRGEEPAAAYRRGDFAAAEKAWTAQVAKDPLNPVARYNLSLALAQQDRWDLALAHASAALLQDPSNPSIRWQYLLAGEKAGFQPTPLAAILSGGPKNELAPLASPTAWQHWVVVAAALFALFLAVLIYGSYRRPSTLRTVLATVGLGAALILALVSLVSIDAYGAAADARAVIVWHGSILRSIPTEADTTQKSTTLAAGSVAVVDQTFLGWVRLSFENGQTGWVRKDEVVGLWK